MKTFYRSAIILIALLFISFSPHLSAQEFAPIGAEWHYSDLEGWSYPEEGYLRIRSVADTMIQGKMCRQLTKYKSNSYESVFEKDEFLYQSGDTIYRLSDNDTFYILYNFNASIGDFWLTRQYDVYKEKDVEMNVYVENIGTIEINGQSYREFYLNIYNQDFSFGGLWPPGGGNARVIEKFGGTWYMFPQNYGLWHWNLRMGVRCYSDPEFGFYQFEDIGCTDILTTSVKELEQSDKLEVFPNPAYGQLEVRLNELNQAAEISVHSLDGRLVQQLSAINSEDRIQINLQQKGIYILLIKIGNDSYRKKIVNL